MMYVSTLLVFYTILEQKVRMLLYDTDKLALQTLIMT